MAASAEPMPPDVNRGPGILIVSWTEAAIGLVVVVARMYTRSRIIRNVGWDDWTMVFAAVLALITTALVTLEVHYGVGRHSAYLDPPDIINAVKMIWLTVPFSTMSACFGKISICLLIMRVLNRNRLQEAFLWCLIGTLFIVNLLLTIITFSQCTPVAHLWNQMDPHAASRGSCWNPSVQRNYGYFQGAFSSLSDLVLALFPIPIIWQLQMKLQVKLGLVAVMSLGVIATVAAAYKTVELRNLATPDFTWNATALVYWYMAENWIIVIAACIPTLAPLYFITLRKKTRESFRQPGSRSSRHLLGNLRAWLSSQRFSSLFNSRNSEIYASNPKGSRKSSSHQYSHSAATNNIDAVTLSLL